jgi:RNA polymerase sigma factor (TIGR02999 family)
MTTPAPQAVTDSRHACDTLPGTSTSMQEPAGEVTTLLQRLAEVDATVETQLFDLVYLDLKRCARNVRRRFRRIHDIQTTELIGSVYLRLAGAIPEQEWRNREHFFAFFARSMQRYMIDYLRKWHKVEFLSLEGLDCASPATASLLQETILVDQLLHKLEPVHPDWATVVRMKCFLGFNDQEIADAMCIPLRTIQKMWFEARLWLFTRMRGRDAKQSTGRRSGDELSRTCSGTTA